MATSIFETLQNADDLAEERTAEERRVAACRSLLERLFRFHPEHAPDRMKDRLLPAPILQPWPSMARRLAKEAPRYRILRFYPDAGCPQASIEPDVLCIIRLVAEFYAVPVREIGSTRRTPRVARARHVACYLARVMTVRSLPEIGQAMGMRAHSAILRGRTKIKEEIKTNRPLAGEVEMLALKIVEMMHLEALAA